MIRVVEHFDFSSTFAKSNRSDKLWKRANAIRVLLVRCSFDEQSVTLIGRATIVAGMGDVMQCSSAAIAIATVSSFLAFVVR